eukprot:TRINITY_DN7215_c0_g1_i1.p1 TRINITY_DN7215_c0_g1~~TRINITY_DN7215_c0_g1_i1.p1  ORF type:complete len:629 (+),score=91.45 TRINITY_DN7215_c0_g1_i1:202-2088(+)
MPDTQITDEALPLSWEKAAEHVKEFKAKAARQFVANWRKHKDRHDGDLKWGEEIEYMLININGGTARASLCADQVLRRLGSETEGADPTCAAGWRTEFGNMMVEGVTYPPFGWALDDVLKVERALLWRRQTLQKMVEEVCPGTLVVTLTAFPLLGCPQSTLPLAEPSPHGDVSCSILCPDEVVSPHPRYQTFVRNYRVRKGCKVGAFLPKAGITSEQRLSTEQLERLPFEVASKNSSERDPVPGYIYMDCQAFGAAQCCTQATFLAPNLEDARYLTDQFLVLAPIFLALTAATPFVRGLVADTDTRWLGFQGTWDDRQETELASIRNSRCSPCDLFISAKLSKDEAAERAANDVEVAIDQAAYDQLVASGIDPLLSRHVAHLLVRDPLMVFESKKDLDDLVHTDHFEQLQGTNWGNVRFKPPPAGGAIGWRVEFRSPEVQMTDFENAATVSVIRLLAEVLLEERWDLVIPISLCEANDMASAERNAACKAKFWWNRGGDVEQRPLADILLGADGILTKCRTWLQRQHDSGKCSEEAKEELFRYMDLFGRRATAELPTPATWMRSLLEKHSSYTGDGTVPVAFTHDLCKLSAEVNDPSLAESRGLGDLLGDLLSSRKRRRLAEQSTATR